MPKPIPGGKKEAIVDMVLSGFPRSRVAQILRVSCATVTTTMRRWATFGEVETKRIRGQMGRKRILTTLDLSFLESCIERTPDILLVELQEELKQCLGVNVSISTIYRALKQRGWSYKKVTTPAREQTESARTGYEWHIGIHYEPEQLVFVDESHCNRFTTHRTMGWAPVGGRARRRDFFIRGTRYSVLPALSLDGVLHLDVQTQSYTGADFKRFIGSLLDEMQPYPNPNSVIVCDNASIHKVAGVREMIEARGMQIVYLPPYSPDLNPIEEGFSAMKAWIRRNRDYVQGELTGAATANPYSMLWAAVFESMTAENAFGWFRHAGYV